MLTCIAPRTHEKTATSGSGPGPSGTGRPHESHVWNFFIYINKEKRNIYQVPLSDDKLCGETFSGRFKSNLKHHLQSCHKEHLAEIIKKDETRKKPKGEHKRTEVGPVKQVLSLKFRIKGQCMASVISKLQDSLQYNYWHN